MNTIHYFRSRIVGFAVILVVISAFHGLCGSTEDSFNGKFLIESLQEIDPWISTNYSEANWRQLCSIAEVIQKSDPQIVSTALREYQAAKTNSSIEHIMEQADYDSKVFLLIRVVFDLPEHADAEKRTPLGNWVSMGTEMNEDGTINRAWPIVWNDGKPCLISGNMGAQTFGRYSADAEFLFFKNKFRFRDLSSFKYGKKK